MVRTSPRQTTCSFERQPSTKERPTPGTRLCASRSEMTVCPKRARMGIQWLNDFHLEISATRLWIWFSERMAQCTPRIFSIIQSFGSSADDETPDDIDAD